MSSTSIGLFDADGTTLITVEPIAAGWRVSTDLEEDLVFFSGGRAEAQARRLGRCLASVGRNVLVEIHDRKNLIIGCIRYDRSLD